MKLPFFKRSRPQGSENLDDWLAFNKEV